MKPLAAGFMRALRFCVMESSTTPRDVLKKSDRRRAYQQGSVKRNYSLDVPRSVTVEKQNWGVSLGCSGCSLIVSGDRGGGVVAAASASEPWRLDHR